MEEHSSRTGRSTRVQPARETLSWIELGLGGLLLTSVIVLGSAHFYVATTLAGFTCLLFTGAGARVQSGWGQPSMLCLALAGWTYLSLVPLPPALLAKLAHQTSELWLDSFALAGQSTGTWAPLSLDPIASAAEAVKWTSYACIAATAGAIARRKGLNPVLRIAWGCAVLVALVSVFQAASGIKSVLGLYEPVSQNSAAPPSLFVNPNNLAGFCNLGAFSGVGLISSRRNRMPQPILYAGTILCAVTTILTASRGGTFTLVVGTLGLLGRWFFSGLSSKLNGYRRPLVGAGVALITTAALIILTVSEATWQSLLDDDLSKLKNLGRLGPALSGHWLFGVGRGAFESVSFLYFGETHHVVHRSVENFVGSWATEWGVPATVLGLGYIAWILTPGRLKLGASRPAQAAYAGLIVIAAQNMVDLGLEIFSVTAVVFAIIGALDGSRHERTSPVKTTTTGKSKLIPGAASLGVLVASAAIYLGPDNFTVKQKLSEDVRHAVSADAPFSRIREMLTREIKWRPADPYFALLGAEVALNKNIDALPWAAAALSRAPHHARSHLLTARSLLQRNALDQATIHLRAALRGEHNLYPRVAELMASRTSDLELIESVAPENTSGAQYLLAVRHRLKSTHPYLGAQLLKSAAAKAPLEENVLAAQGFQLVADLAQGSYPCGHGGQRCEITDLDKWAQRVRANAALHPESHTCANRRVLSQLAKLDNKPHDAMAALEGCAGCPVAEPCLRDQVMVAAQLNDTPQRKHAERLYLESVCALPTPCTKALLWLGQLASARQDWLAATSHFSRAASYEPNGKNWLLVANAAIRANQITRAELAYRKANSLGTTDRRIAELIRKARLDLLRRVPN